MFSNFDIISICGLLLCFIRNAVSFHITTRHSFYTKSSEFGKRKHVIFSSVQDANNHQSSPPTKICDGKNLQDFELWLDLRGTTISPQVGLSHLINDLWDEFTPPQDKSFLVDKVIVDATKLSGTEMEKIYNEVNDEYEDEIEILFYKDHNMLSLDVVSNEHDDKNGDAFCRHQRGKDFQMFDMDTGVIHAYTDPFPALEVISSGQWLVLDSSGMRDDNERREAIESLVELCSGGLSPTLTLIGQNEFNHGSSLRGGVAIDCSSDTDILEACTFMKSMTGNPNDYITTDSGILIESKKEEPSSTKIEQNLSTSKSMDFAILIPFDALLWKTASLVATSST